MKTSEMTGAALDWAVAKCEGHDAHFYNGVVRTTMKGVFGSECSYSTDWAQGGAIIERERINLEPFSNINGEQWTADGEWDSPTPLIAAMRCYVASKLGDEVEIPEELK
jgi:hypothetical protein